MWSNLPETRHLSQLHLRPTKVSVFACGRVKWAYSLWKGMCTRKRFFTCSRLQLNSGPSVWQVKCRETRKDLVNEGKSSLIPGLLAWHKASWCHYKPTCKYGDHREGIQGPGFLLDQNRPGCSWEMLPDSRLPWILTLVHFWGQHPGTPTHSATKTHCTFIMWLAKLSQRS